MYSYESRFPWGLQFLSRDYLMADSCSTRPNNPSKYILVPVSVQTRPNGEMIRVLYSGLGGAPCFTYAPQIHDSHNTRTNFLDTPPTLASGRVTGSRPTGGFPVDKRAQRFALERNVVGLQPLTCHRAPFARPCPDADFSAAGLLSSIHRYMIIDIKCSND